MKFNRKIKTSSNNTFPEWNIKIKKNTSIDLTDKKI